MSINHVCISGNLTRDAELKRSQSGMAILGFSVAVNERRKNNQTGEYEDYANFIDCRMFGTRAEKIAMYLTKGLKVSVDGKLRWSQWERDGQKRSKVEVIVDEIEFMSSRNQGQVSQPMNSGYQNSGYQNNAYQDNGGQQAQTSIYDDDIPF